MSQIPAPGTPAPSGPPSGPTRPTPTHPPKITPSRGHLPIGMPSPAEYAEALPGEYVADLARLIEQARAVARRAQAAGVFRRHGVEGVLVAHLLEEIDGIRITVTELAERVPQPPTRPVMRVPSPVRVEWPGTAEIEASINEALVRRSS